MTWLVSGRAYDERGERIAELQEDKRELQAQVASLLDHIVRLERASQGLPENAPHTRKPLEPMPAEVKEMIDAWDNEDVRQDLSRRAHNLARRKGWDAAKELLERATFGGDE